MILCGASGLYALLVEREWMHHAVRDAFVAEPGPYVVSPFVLAEVDYLLATRSGVRPQIDLLEDVARGAYELAGFDRSDIGAAREVMTRFADLRIGLADASIVVLAGRYRTDRVLTLDERHFRALRTPSGAPFTILPADA